MNVLANRSSSTAGYAWAVVALLWPVALLNYLDRLMIASMRVSVVKDIPMDDGQFGLLTTVFLWVYGALSPLGGYVADRFSRRWMIVGSVGVWSLVTWLTAHAHTFQMMLWTRAMMGISEAFYIPAALALIADYHRGPTRSLATGLHMSGVYAGAALGGIGGFFADYIGWRWGFAGFGIFGVAYAVFLLFVLKDWSNPDEANRTGAEAGQSFSGVQEPGTNTERAAPLQPLDYRAKEEDEEQAPTIGRSMKALFTRPSFIFLMLSFSLVAIANWGIYGWLPTFCMERFNLTQTQAGLMATFYIQAASFAGVMSGGPSSDRWARRNPRGRLYIPVLGFVFGGPFLFLVATTVSPALAIAGMIVFGISRGFFDTSAMPILCQIVRRRYRATGYGMLNCLSVFVGGIMVWVGGILRDSGVSLVRVFQFSACGLLVAAAVLLLVRPGDDAEEKS